jgi:hypothetical protein
MRRALLCPDLTGEVDQLEGKQGVRVVWSGLMAAMRTPAKCDANADSGAALWLDWMECLFDPAHPARNIGGEAAHALRAVAAGEIDSEITSRRALAAGAGIDLGLGVHSLAVGSPATFARLARCAPSPGLYAILDQLARAEPAWTAAAVRWALRDGNTAWATHLWTGVCDEFMTADTAATVHALAQVFEQSRGTTPLSVDLCRVRSAVLAVSGRTEPARSDLRWLAGRNGSAAASAMMSILRAWLPALKLGTEGVLPRGAREWWLGEMDVLCAGRAADVRIVRIFGEIWIGARDRVLRWLEQKPVAMSEAMWIAIILWIQDEHALARAVWEPFLGSPLPDQPDQRLRCLCGRLRAERRAVPRIGVSRVIRG